MKVVLAHDWFNTQPRGAEKVTLELANMFPRAPIYTLIYNQAKFGNGALSKRIKTSFLQGLPPILRQQARYFLPLIPTAINSWHFNDYDLILSCSSAFTKNVSKPKGALHICYCCTPARFVWDYAEQYLSEQPVGKLQQTIGNKLRQRFKRWDVAGTKNVDYFIADSKTVAKRIKRYYNRSSSVIYPPVDVDSFKPMVKDTSSPYYVTLSGLTPYKKIDLAIEACNIGGRRLVVIGDGPQRARLQKLAGPSIEFAGYVNDQRKAELLAQAQALIFPNEEDFGIAPVEAMAAGTPVLAYNRGGVTESVVAGKTGLFFDKQTPERLSEALDQFETMEFKIAELLAQAKKFDRQVFRDKMNKFINQAYAKHVNAN